MLHNPSIFFIYSFNKLKLLSKEMASHEKKMLLEFMNEREALSPMYKILKNMDYSFCDQHFRELLMKLVPFKLHLIVKSDPVLA